MKAMQEFLKILMELFYILLFRQLSWFLSGDKMQIVRRKVASMKPKSLTQPTPVKVTSHGVPVLSAHGKS
jgi:hypothetical protein